MPTLGCLRYVITDYMALQGCQVDRYLEIQEHVDINSMVGFFVELSSNDKVSTGFILRCTVDNSSFGTRREWDAWQSLTWLVLNTEAR
jgi:hypothetical protein